MGPRTRNEVGLGVGEFFVAFARMALCHGAFFEEGIVAAVVDRDAVLREAQNVLSDASDAKQAIAAQLPALEAAANAELRRQGSGDTACVSFRRELFPTRDYDTFSLPSGVYQSLRVTIGEGAGHNWWCVIFPSLCVPATTDGFADAAAAGGFSDAEIGLMTRANGAYTVKFRSLELLQALKKYLFGE